jgi:hypothetical protein
MAAVDHIQCPTHRRQLDGSLECAVVRIAQSAKLGVTGEHSVGEDFPS